MEPAPSPSASNLEARGQRRRRALAAVVLVSALILAPAVWWLWARTYSIAELEGMMHECSTGGSLCRFSPGQTVRLAGTVARVGLANTSLGPLTLVYLDQSGTFVAIRGDARAEFPAGSWVTIPLIIRSYRYNGIEYLSADEFPMPALTASIAVIFAAMSRVAGVGLLPVPGPADALTLQVSSDKGEAFPLDLFRVSIARVHGPMYDAESGVIGGLGTDEAEGWTPTGNDSSPRGLLSFTDSAGNGRLDVGDRVTVRPDNRTTSPRDIESRVLLVNNLTGILMGVYYYLLTSEGIPYFTDLSDLAPLVYQSWRPGSFVLGPPESVSPFELATEAGRTRPTDETFAVRDAQGRRVATGTFGADPFLSVDGMTGRFLDLDADGWVSVGDRLEFRGGSPNTSYSMDLFDPAGSLGSLTWRPGLGAYTGAYPLVGFSNESRLNATSLQADVRITGAFPWEAIRNFTLELFQGGTHLLSLDLSRGTSSTAGGLRLGFLSAGDPVALDAGDRVRVEGLRPGLAYEVRVLWTGLGSGTRLAGAWAISN